LIVRPLDRAEQRHQHATQPGLVGRAPHLGAHLLDRAPAQHRHGHVGGAVGLPEAVHLEQRRVIEARQQLGLVDEALQTQRKALGVGVRADRDVQGFGASGQRGRHVLLDRDLALERVVHREVHNAEAAHAQHPEQLEFAEPGARVERVRRVGSVRGGTVGHVFKAYTRCLRAPPVR
jgi:hypothetical protein